MKLEEALTLLGFSDVNAVPKVKKIQKQFYKLSMVRHPDKNNGSKEATEAFQELLTAYHVAGKAAENMTPETEDHEDIVARKIFKQFQFSSVKVNSQSITIKTEKKLNSLWMEILSTNLGKPEDNKGTHGRKYTMVDKCDDTSVNIFITMYHTGNMLLQAQGNKQSVNIHFMNTHLKDLYLQVYNRAQLQQKLMHVAQPQKTPLRKPTNPIKGIKQQIKCPKCEYQTNITAHLAKHMKKEHKVTAVQKLSIACEELSETEEVASINADNMAHEVFEDVVQTKLPVSHCMLCGYGFNSDLEVDAHVESVHALKCSTCSDVFYDQYDLKMHMMKHTPSPLTETSRPEGSQAKEITDSVLQVNTSEY